MNIHVIAYDYKKHTKCQYEAAAVHSRLKTCNNGVGTKHIYVERANANINRKVYNKYSKLHI